MKKYLVDEDIYSGQIVITCEVEEVELRTLENPDQVHYLYDEPIYRYSKHIAYTVKAYFHYEDEANREDNCLVDETVYDDKDKANELFKEVVQYMK